MWAKNLANFGQIGDLYATLTSGYGDRLPILYDRKIFFNSYKI